MPIFHNPVELVGDSSWTMESLNADEILASYVAESDDSAAEQILHTLITDVAAPYVRIVASSSLRGPHQSEASDATQEVLLDLTCRLRRLREVNGEAVPGDEPIIRNFRAYMASAARRAAGFILRRTNPERYRLRSRVRYALKTNPALQLTEDDQGRQLAGLSRPTRGNRTASAEKLGEVPVPKGASALSLSQLIELVLGPVGTPVFLDDLTEYIGMAVGGLARLEPFESAAAVVSSNLSDQMEQREWLTHLWGEIVELPKNQRVALLLNLRDHIGDSALRLLPALGIASIRQIAEVLEMVPEALAALWRTLPIDDQQIAETLVLTRQQVVNLRKSARERLIRRMGVRR